MGWQRRRRYTCKHAVFSPPFRPPSIQHSRQQPLSSTLNSQSLEDRIHRTEAQLAAITHALGCGAGGALSAPNIVAPGGDGSDLALSSTATSPAVSTAGSVPVPIVSAGSHGEGDSSDLEGGSSITKTTQPRLICLGDGTVITFTNADVPNPPVISFVDDIARLNQIWDDTSSFWNPADCALRIHDHPIALVHWKAIYSYGKTGQWRGTRNKWADWQVREHPSVLRL
jgi:hypothetical protein